MYKQELFLVAAGRKPVAAVPSGHWMATSEGRRTVPDPIEDVATLLDELGLKYQLTEADFATDAIVSLSTADIKAYKEASSSSEFGWLAGYPVSATEAFEQDDCISFEEQDKLLVSAGVPASFNTFRFSKRYADEELEVVVAWYQLVEQFGLGDDTAAARHVA